jgi:hypothetical protein
MADDLDEEQLPGEIGKPNERNRRPEATPVRDLRAPDVLHDPAPELR